MNESLHAQARHIAEKIISLSELVDHELERWSDLERRPDDLSSTEIVGFINKQDATEGLDFVVDLCARDGDDQSTLRTWLIRSPKAGDAVETYDNIQLDFDISYDRARDVTAKGENATRNDLLELVNLPDSRIKHIIVADNSGGPDGRRLDVDATTTLSQGQLEDVSAELNTVMAILETVVKNRS